MGTVISKDGRFEWDEVKSEINKAKHGLDFEEILPVFEDPYMIEFYDDAHSTDIEDRIIGIGMLQGVLVLIVCYTQRSDRTRIFSARKALHREEDRYYEQLKDIIT
jgi:uncharacterized DUF497 family protein